MQGRDLVLGERGVAIIGTGVSECPRVVRHKEDSLESKNRGIGPIGTLMGNGYSMLSVRKTPAIESSSAGIDRRPQTFDGQRAAGAIRG